jgi:hypothetical protein
VRELASYWRDEYDWRVHEARLNGFDQFTITIDGARVHFLHVRSASPDALPLIITHGWPGSVVEFWDIIGPLTDPAAFGGAAEDAFHLVIPSIPGYGFSGPTHDRGWAARRVARAWAVLMARLGYQRYGAQGGDWGSGDRAADPALRRTVGHHRALDRVRPWRPLRGHGGARPAGRRRARVLPAAALTLSGGRRG